MILNQIEFVFLVPKLYNVLILSYFAVPQQGNLERPPITLGEKVFYLRGGQTINVWKEGKVNYFTSLNVINITSRTVNSRWYLLFFSLF